jgi:hypothetical protein
MELHPSTITRNNAQAALTMRIANILEQHTPEAAAAHIAQEISEFGDLEMVDMLLR